MGLYAVADFCLIPMGPTESGPTISVGVYIAECQKVLESYQSKGISFEMHGYGTNLEGPFSLVCEAVEKCHEAVHEKGIPRISSDIRIGTRTDKPAPSISTSKESNSQEAKKETEQPLPVGEEWSKGLTENQRKKESVRRILSNSSGADVKDQDASLTNVQVEVEVEDLYAVADFCVLPMGTPSTSVGPYIAECQRTLEGMKPEGIQYEIHGYGTNLEGKFEKVTKAIEKCHLAVHRKGAPRIATDIRIGSRTDKKPPSFNQETQGEDEDWTKGLTENQRKKESVRRILAKDANKSYS